MKSILRMVWVLFLFLGALAAQARVNQPGDTLARVMDEFEYAVTVEWDQRDFPALDRIRADFVERIHDLPRSERRVGDFRRLLERHGFSRRDARLVVRQLRGLETAESRSLPSVLRILVDHAPTGASWGTRGSDAVLITELVALAGIEVMTPVWERRSIPAENGSNID